MAWALVPLAPVACLTDEDPRPFTTSDSCFPGDVEDCVCERDGQLPAAGTRTCPKSRHFQNSPCNCTVAEPSGTGGKGQ